MLAAMLLVAHTSPSTAVVAGTRAASPHASADSGDVDLEQDDDYIFSSLERMLLGTGAGSRAMQLWYQQHQDGGLAPKPDSLGPDSAAWSNTVAICSLIKDENSTDVREWVIYYRCAQCLVHCRTASSRAKLSHERVRRWNCP